MSLPLAVLLVMLPTLALARPGEIEAQDPSDAVLEAVPDRKIQGSRVEPDAAATKTCPFARPRAKVPATSGAARVSTPSDKVTAAPTKVGMPSSKVHPATAPTPTPVKAGCPFVRHTAPAAGELLDDPALGTRSSPVLCAEPKGERAYLARLRCRDGQAPTYGRMGSTSGGPDGHILDLYDVTCPRGRNLTLFMDMYHLGYVETRAVEGFTIVAP